MISDKLRKLSSKYKKRERNKAASLLDEAVHEIERLLVVEQTAGDLCKDCGWAGIRPPDPCAFCNMSKNLKSDIDSATFQSGCCAGLNASARDPQAAFMNTTTNKDYFIENKMEKLEDMGLPDECVAMVRDVVEDLAAIEAQRDALQRALWEQGERLKEAVATEQRLLSMLGTLMKSAERVGSERDAAEARALALGAQAGTQVVAQGRQQAKDKQPDLVPCFCAELSGTCPKHPRVKALP